MADRAPDTAALIAKAVDDLDKVSQLLSRAGGMAVAAGLFDLVGVIGDAGCDLKLDQDVSFVQVTGGGNCTVANARDAMGIDWMTKDELNEALPPAYTEHIGAALMAEVTRRKEAAA